MAMSGRAAMLRIRGGTERRLALAEIATAAGLSPAAVTAFLTGDAGAEEVRELEEKAIALGVSGVPFFVFDDKTAISGAQSVETFVSALQELAE